MEHYLRQFGLLEQRPEGAPEELALPKRCAAAKCEGEAAFGVTLCVKRGKPTLGLE